MLKFLVWCLLLVLCWPLAICVAILFPLIWLILLPFKLAGLAVQLVAEMFALPFKILKVIF